MKVAINIDIVNYYTFVNAYMTILFRYFNSLFKTLMEGICLIS